MYLVDTGIWGEQTWPTPNVCLEWQEVVMPFTKIFCRKNEFSFRYTEVVVLAEHIPTEIFIT
jgi:hypothetical protein